MSKYENVNPNVIQFEDAIAATKRILNDEGFVNQNALAKMLQREPKASEISRNKFRQLFKDMTEDGMIVFTIDDNGDRGYEMSYESEA